MNGLRELTQCLWSDLNHLWVVEYVWFIIGALLLITQREIKKRGWLFGLTFFWFSFCAVRVFAISQPVHPDWPFPVTLLLESAAASTLFFLMLYYTLVSLFEPDAWVRIFRVVGWANAVGIILGAFHGTPYGLLVNASMSGCLSAVLLPFFLEKKRLGAAVLIVSIFIARQSLPLAVSSVMLAVFLVRHRCFLTLLLSGGAILAVGKFLTHHEDGSLFNTHGRWLTWEDSFRWFNEHLSLWLGGGSGSFFALGPMLTAKTGNLFLWAHSEYLQVLLEQGIIGLTLLVSLYGMGLWKSRKMPALFYSLIGYGAFGVANMPFRFPVSALLGAVLIQWAYAEKQGEDHGIDRCADGSARRGDGSGSREVRSC